MSVINKSCNYSEFRSVLNLLLMEVFSMYDTEVQSWSMNCEWSGFNSRRNMNTVFLRRSE